jgi:hypothetical protein
MGFLRRLFGGSADVDVASPPARPSDDEAEWRTAHEATFDATADRHRVTVWLRLTDPAFENEREQQRLFGLENTLMRALDASAAGEHDSNSLEEGFLAIRLVGDDAEQVVAVVRPLLADAPRGSYLAVRRGPAGSAEERLDLGPGRRGAGSDSFA